MKVFVYGTLKSGEPNHHWLTDLENGHASFVGAGKTIAKYPLVIASKYNIPFLLDVPGQGNVSLFYSAYLSHTSVNVLLMIGYNTRELSPIGYAFRTGVHELQHCLAPLTGIGHISNFQRRNSE